MYILKKMRYCDICVLLFVLRLLGVCPSTLINIYLLSVLRLVLTVGQELSCLGVCSLRDTTVLVLVCTLVVAEIWGIGRLGHPYLSYLPYCFITVSSHYSTGILFPPPPQHLKQESLLSWWMSLMSLMVGVPCTIYSISCFFIQQSFYDKIYSIFRGRK